jgi:hypothetical protein
MTGKRILRRLAFLLLALGSTRQMSCAGTPTIRDDDTTRAPMRVSDHGASGSSLELAREYLRAFRSGDSGTLNRLSCKRFSFHTTAQKNECATQAESSAQLAQLMACVRGDALLKEELSHAEEFEANATSLRETPDWARTFDESESGADAVASYINGDGITFSVVVLVTAECVESLMLSASFEDG